MFTETSNLQQNLLIIFTTNAIIASFFILTSRNPIYALISTIIVFINTILILLTFNIEFLALIFLIIYIGAIAILFLFVIMMFNLKKLRSVELPDEFWLITFIYFIITPKVYMMIIEYINNFLESNYINESLNYKQLSYILHYQSNDILIFSSFFYTEFYYCFILLGVILLTAMLGSIILALSTMDDN